MTLTDELNQRELQISDRMDYLWNASSSVDHFHTQVKSDQEIDSLHNSVGKSIYTIWIGSGKRGREYLNYL